MTFEQVVMPDGTARGRKMWRAVDGENYAAFYPTGRKGRFHVTWGSANGSGGEQVSDRETAELKAAAILMRLAGIQDIQSKIG